MSMQGEQSSKPHLSAVNPEPGDAQFSRRVRSLRLPQESAGGGSLGRWIMGIVVLLLAGSTGVLGYLHFFKSPEPVQKTAAKPDVLSRSASVPPATTASSGQVALEAKGYIIPAHQILVSPKVGGMVVKLRITESQRVVKGEVLAELEDTEYRADRNSAKAMLESAKHNLEELEHGSRPDEISQARAELGEAEVQRYQLAADYRRAAEMLSKRVISKEQYDETLSEYHAMDRRMQRLQAALNLLKEGPRVERINVARAQVAQTEAELTKAEWRLDNCVIRAPISGTILIKSAEEGSLVNPVAMQGFYSLCEMADLSDLEVDLTIQERDISKIFKGQKCKVRAEAFPDRVYEGYVSRLMPTADRAKGAIPVRVKVAVPAEEEGVYLKPEMGALVSFLKK